MALHFFPVHAPDSCCYISCKREFEFESGMLLGAARSWPAGLDLGLVGPVALTPLPSPSWPPVYAAVARLGLMVSAEQRVVRPARWPGSGGPA
jgi:hypothetical protein